MRCSYHPSYTPSKCEACLSVWPRTTLSLNSKARTQTQAIWLQCLEQMNASREFTSVPKERLRSGHVSWVSQNGDLVERPFHEAVTLKPELPWRTQDS